ncbi:MAG: RNase adapter RapZ [Burkholderia sp.]|nr:RNase adapter RapZ [Burkholderia sp.]
MHIVLITGISGSGKSIALNALEDAGYYCVDNLPPHVLPKLISYLENEDQKKLAVSIDARSSASLDEMPRLIKNLSRYHDLRILFLSANTQALIQRFSETRRRHPLSIVPSNGLVFSQTVSSLEEAIEREREFVEPLAEFGHRLDTSALLPNMLRSRIRLFTEQKNDDLILTFESFGFKRGVPIDADFIFDVRILPNPFYNNELRLLSGLDQPVVAFLDKLPIVHQMMDDIHEFLIKWLPHFRDDNRSYMTVGIGCTGGQHRSVFIVEVLATRFVDRYENTMVRHRDITTSLYTPSQG